MAGGIDLGQMAQDFQSGQQQIKVKNIASQIAGLYKQGLPQEEVMKQSMPLIAQVDPQGAMQIGQQLEQQKQQKLSQKMQMWQYQVEQTTHNPGATQADYDKLNKAAQEDPDLSQIVPKTFSLTKTEQGTSVTVPWGQIGAQQKQDFLTQHPGVSLKDHDLMAIHYAGGKITGMDAAATGVEGGGTGSGTPTLTSADKRNYNTFVRQYTSPSSQTDMGRTNYSLTQANKVVNVLENTEKLTPQQFHDLQFDLAYALTGRSNMPVSQVKQVIADNVGLKVSDIKQFFSSKPQDIMAKQSKTIRVILDTLQHVQEANAQTAANTLEEASGAYATEIQPFSNDWESFKKSHMSRYEDVSTRIQKLKDEKFTQGGLSSPSLPKQTSSVKTGSISVKGKNYDYVSIDKKAGTLVGLDGKTYRIPK